jgi:tetratricopeptide (TPR) repeat protein
MNRRDRRATQKSATRGRNAVSPFRSASRSEDLYRMAVQSHQAGRLDEAEKLYRGILANDPKHVGSLNGLGALAMHQARFDAAVKYFNAVLCIDETVPETHNNLGLALLKQGKPQAAAQACLRALELRPQYPEAHNSLGLALQHMNNHEEAIRHFEDALALRDSAAAWQNLRISLGALGRYEEAIARFETALSRKPHSADLHRNLGTMLLTLGYVDRACAEFKRSIELDPSKPSSFHRLAEACPMTSNDPWLARMEQLAIKMDKLNPADQIELHFALGKALGNAGQKARSFRHYLAGNALKRSQIRYDETATLASLDKTRAVITRGFLERYTGAGDPTPVPVFVVGMPRSGTTLVEQMLASHPSVSAVGETSEFVSAVARVLGAHGETSYSLVDRLDKLSRDQCREIGAYYGAAIRTIAPRGERVVDKMPMNFRFVGLICAALPNARIIHLRRDAIDTCLSCFSQLFDGNLPFTYELGELGRYWKAYERLMAHWRAILPHGVMIEPQYEELVRDFEAHARHIVAHCGLPWDSACLRFHEAKRPVATASWVQVRRPVYTSSTGRWRPDDALLGPLLRALDQGSSGSPL